MMTLNDGRRAPQFGLGVWQIPDREVAQVVQQAIECGYRSMDTATIYRNESGVGEGIRACGVPREQLFITTKLWNDSHGRERTLRAFDLSLKRLRLDYVDLYLIHWPVPGANLYVETWQTLLQLRNEGRARSVGVCSFTRPYLQRLLEATGEAPAVNQIELHPCFQQRDVVSANAQYGVITESWSPLGNGQLLGHARVRELARRVDRTPAQVVLRWHLQHGYMVIPKTAQVARLRENLAACEFQLDASAMTLLDKLDDVRGRTGGDPETEQ